MCGLTGSVFLVMCVIWSFDLRTSLASPVVGEERDKEGDHSNRALIRRRSLEGLEIADPHEKCFETTCNRVTHYCDEVIRSCASCEDDCHPGRISGDDDTTKDCLKKCDWYYYINSLKANLCSASEVTKPSNDLTGNAGAQLTDYRLFVIILALVTVCFTTIIIILVGVFCCFLRKSLRKPTVVRQEAAYHSSLIYKPQRPHSSTDSKRRQNVGDTDVKLLANCSEDSLQSNGIVQQESVRNSSNNPSSISLASNSQGLNCCNNSYVAGQDRRQSNSLHQSHTDSSTRQLVK